MTAGEHSHAHGHDHAEPEEGSAVVADASLAIDIGEGHGALIIYPEERWRGREIEISPTHDEAARVHTGVHDRTTVAGVTRLTAVFGSLPIGEYVIRGEVGGDPDVEGPTVEVPEAGIAEIALA